MTRADRIAMLRHWRNVWLHDVRESLAYSDGEYNRSQIEDMIQCLSAGIEDLQWMKAQHEDKQANG
jgi:hypothetical protein